MGMMIGIAALAIDVSQWYVNRHQAQTVADAAALAAANCLATKKCTQTTWPNSDTATAINDVAAKATTGTGVTVTNVEFTSSTVKVTTENPSSSPFAGLFGIGSVTTSATATASYKTGVVAQSSVYGAGCASPTNPPTNGCTVDCTHPGVTINTQGSTSITGAIETNGYVSITIKGSTSLGPVESGPGVGMTCGSNSTSVGGSASIAYGPADATGFTAFPTTYSAVWTSATSNECTASSTYTGAGYTGSSYVSVSGGTSTVPSKITLGTSSNQTIGSAATPVVMCASTSISIPKNSMTLTDVTLVAPSISIGGNNLTITPDPNAIPDGGGTPAVALYDTGTQALDFGTNDVNVTGAVYAPLAEIVIKGNNSGQALIEGNTVEIDGNNTADGPSSALSAFNGGDQLIQ